MLLTVLHSPHHPTRCALLPKLHITPRAARHLPSLFRALSVCVCVRVLVSLSVCANRHWHYTLSNRIDLRTADLYHGFTMAVKYTRERLLLNFNSGASVFWKDSWLPDVLAKLPTINMPKMQVLTASCCAWHVSERQCVCVCVWSRKGGVWSRCRRIVNATAVCVRLLGSACDFWALLATVELCMRRLRLGCDGCACDGGLKCDGW